MKSETSVRRGIGWRARLFIIAMGIVTGLYGFAKIKQGRPIYENYRGQDINAIFVMALGGLTILFALFPWGLVGFLWEGGDPKKLRRKGLDRYRK